MWEICHVISSKNVCIIVCGVSSMFPHLALYPDLPTYPQTLATDISYLDGQLFLFWYKRRMVWLIISNDGHVLAVCGHQLEECLNECWQVHALLSLSPSFLPSDPKREEMRMECIVFLVKMIFLENLVPADLLERGLLSL